MNGLCDMAERVLNCQARNGLAQGIRDWPEEIDDPVWTTARGFDDVFGEAEGAGSSAAAQPRDSWANAEYKWKGEL